MTTNLTDEERLKLKVIGDLLQKKIKTKQAGKILSLSTRQIRRLKNRIKRDGMLAVDGSGIPLTFLTEAANISEFKLALQTIDSRLRE